MPVTPARLGYRMPAEWEEHRGTWLSWPKDPGTFPGDYLPRVEAAYVKIVETLGDGEEVHLLVDDAKAKARVGSMLKGDPRVAYHLIRTVDVWVRDYGPIYLKGKDLALVKWKFNAWGEKYEDLRRDDGAGEEIARGTGLEVFSPGMVLEGGSIDVDGAGTVLTTEQCLLNPNRNPTLGKAGVERALEDNLGTTRTVWLGRGIEGDDTDGHVDDIARFVGPARVMAAAEPDRSDPNHGPLERNLEILRMSRDRQGRPLAVTEVPMPPPIEADGKRLPASHLNFYIGNSVVLVPTFGGASDKEATGALAEAFPKREVVGVDCRALVYGLGTIHCATQQIPADPT